ncbi:MAG TPA: hypothetical protein IAB23_01960 [Candidatus Scybalocola faecavium]|nr:hypothetical protein [Candidatus Scybalocola faecavium]
MAFFILDDDDCRTDRKADGEEGKDQNGYDYCRRDTGFLLLGMWRLGGIWLFGFLWC